MGHHAFGLEHLEGRQLFSGGAVGHTFSTFTPVPVVTTTTVVHPHPLTGAFNVAGTYDHPISIGHPDTSGEYLFTGTGKKKATGLFTLTGHLEVPGFIQNGQASGKLFITNAKGSIVLSVVGPPQQPGVLPPSLTFTILKGHGAYLHSKGTGTILIQASETTHKFVFRFNQSA